MDQSNVPLYTDVCIEELAYQHDDEEKKCNKKNKHHHNSNYENKMAILNYCIQNYHDIAWALMKYNFNSEGHPFLDLNESSKLQAEREHQCTF
jgi:hypothetical protein